jgi:hypothetical protein
MIDELYFFGCRKDSYSTGHYAYLGRDRCDNGSKNSLDSGLLRIAEIPERQGRGCYAQVGTFSIVTFWDYTGDKRSGSNSAFFAEGRHTAEQLLAAAREQYPEIWARFTFEIKLSLAEQP